MLPVILVIIFIGMLLGGYIGANTAIKKGDRWIRSLFTLVIAVFVAKILFF